MELDGLNKYINPADPEGTLKKCTCGNTYHQIQIHDLELIDPGKCQECIKKTIENEKQDIINRVNTALTDKELDRYKPYSVFPPGCEDATFDNYEPQNETQAKALEKAKEFVENIDVNSSKSLMFQGTPGIGKSHLSMAIHKALRDKHIPSLVIDSPSLFQTLKSYFGYSDSSSSQERLMKMLFHADVLILDDIGAEYVKENNGNETWASDILYQIMNARQTKVNVFSTNYKSADLKQKYGSLSSRIISRMLAGAEVIKIEGQDQRMRGFE